MDGFFVDGGCRWVGLEPFGNNHGRERIGSVEAVLGVQRFPCRISSALQLLEIRRRAAFVWVVGRRVSTEYLVHLSNCLGIPKYVVHDTYREKKTSAGLQQ